MKTMMRGKLLLGHQSQVLQRDLTGEEILKNRGAVCSAFAITPEQAKTFDPFRNPRLYYVKFPNAPALSWVAFETIEGLQQFCEAYNLTCEPTVPVQGKDFRVILPDGPEGFQPLHGGPPVYPEIIVYNNVGIIGDGNIYHTPCARKEYGDAAITRMLADIDYAYGHDNVPLRGIQRYHDSCVCVACGAALPTMHSIYGPEWRLLYGGSKAP